MITVPLQEIFSRGGRWVVRGDFFNFNFFQFIGFWGL